jgi:MoxR-like ATPase
MEKKLCGKDFSEEIIGDVKILLPKPITLPDRKFVGNDELLADCEAAWLRIGEEWPLNFRISGPPGIGKNELIYELCRRRGGCPLYILQGHEDLTPEDLVCTARINKNNQVEYVGSPLLAAMYYGGVALFDEVDKVPTRSLSVLASVLDDRRRITSVMASISLPAQEDFRFCALINETDPTTYKLPDYIDQRLRPIFTMKDPSYEEVMEILTKRFSGEHQKLIEHFMEQSKKIPKLTPRDAIMILTYAIAIYRKRKERISPEEIIIESIERMKSNK